MFKVTNSSFKVNSENIINDDFSCHDILFIFNYKSNYEYLRHLQRKGANTIYKGMAENSYLLVFGVR